MNKETKEIIEDILTELYHIRANIPLTNGSASRGMMRKLIKNLEGEVK